MPTESSSNRKEKEAISNVAASGRKKEKQKEHQTLVYVI
jgi:hypothetical protein